jgi:hypothetical protein
MSVTAFRRKEKIFIQCLIPLFLPLKKEDNDNVPGVSMTLIFVSPFMTARFFARMVIPLSLS